MAIDYSRYVNLQDPNQDLIDTATARKFEIQMSLPAATVSEKLALTRELELIKAVLEQAAEENSLFGGYEIVPPSPHASKRIIPRFPN